MKNILIKTLEQVPYNSFGKIILSEGREYPESYGGNCVFQCRKITSDLVAAQLNLTDISYATAIEKPHWVIFVQDGDTYMLDPFLFCPEPINISKVLAGENQILDTYPKGTNKVEVKQLSDQKIHVSLFTKKGSNWKQVLEYTYDLSIEKPRELPPDNYQLLANLCQKNLEMGILMSSDKTGEVTRIYRQPGQGNMDIRVIGGEHYSATKNPAGFEEQLEKITGKLGTTREEFIQTWGIGEMLYLQKQVELCQHRLEK